MSVEAKLSRLSLDLKSTQAGQSVASTLPTEPNKVPESWDDEDNDDEYQNDVAVEAPGPSLKKIASNDEAFQPPPPTPASPLSVDAVSHGWSSPDVKGLGRESPRYMTSGKGDDGRRPEKTTATANRLIAGALGIKAPKKTEEQRQYDRAVKEAEIKRKKREKEEQERFRLEDEKAKAAVWDG